MRRALFCRRVRSTHPPPHELCTDKVCAPRVDSHGAMPAFQAGFPQLQVIVVRLAQHDPCSVYENGDRPNRGFCAIEARFDTYTVGHVQSHRAVTASLERRSYRNPGFLIQICHGNRMSVACKPVRNSRTNPTCSTGDNGRPVV